MTVLQVCAYGAEYPGNFIASLTDLEKKLSESGVKTIYAFVERAAEKSWCKEICKRTKVYFLPEAKARILPKTYKLFKKIYAENDINIVHSHFELYDMPATIMAPSNVKVFWHLHDPIQVGNNLSDLLWRIQYGIVGKKAFLLSVSDYYRRSVVSLGFPEAQTTTVLNGIDTSRICHCSEDVKRKVNFLTFGWDFYRKGDDIILNACEKLYQEGYNFTLMLNGNEHTWPNLDKFLDGAQPPYLLRGNPSSDVNALYNQADVFIQASRQETFSYAVCEAAYAGLPVISSDISGLEWAHALPSVTFFESENVQELYICMKSFLDGRRISQEHTMKSKQIIQDNLSLDTWSNTLIKIYGLG